MAAQMLETISRTQLLTERKAADEKLVKEGIELWKQQKEQARLRKIQEQKEMREMLEKYWPFERTTEIKPRGLRNLRMEGLFPNKDFQEAKRFVGTLDMGRPGGGAPIFSENGKKLTRTREDPLLRFQFGSHDLRKCVDNALRYKTSKKSQEQYRKELDALIEEKKKLEEKRKQDLQDLDKKQVTLPRKVYATKPRKLDPIFYPCKNIYTGAKTRKLTPLSNGKDTGIELVPIITKSRFPKKIHLETTDVTNDKKIHIASLWNRQGSAYLRELKQQVLCKQQKLKEMKAEETETSQKHFITWEGFWGRPGHGAPRSGFKKQRLDRLLYPQIVPISVH